MEPLFNAFSKSLAESVQGTGNWIATGTDAELFDKFVSVLDALSFTVALFTIVVPAVPALAVAAIVRVAVELALMSPIVQVPVLEA
jgi:hypothetical protein